MTVASGGFIGPRTAAQQAGALTLDDLATVLDVETEVAGRLLPVAVAMVERFAADAPVEIRNEAVIRLAGWLRQSPPGDLVPTGVGGIEFSWRPGASRNAMRQSGAVGLLAPWRKPRGLVVGDD